MSKDKAHTCHKSDLLELRWDPESESRHKQFKGTHETCMTGPLDYSTGRGIHINILPVIRAKNVSMNFKIWSKDKKAPLFQIYGFDVQIVGGVTQITVNAVELQPSIGTDVIYFMDYDIKFKN